MLPDRVHDVMNARLHARESVARSRLRFYVAPDPGWERMRVRGVRVPDDPAEPVRFGGED